MKKIVILTGAGISEESGIMTFRDSNGLWEQYKIEDVATYRGFQKNPQLVLDFYNARRKDVLSKQPNTAHNLLAELEKDYEVQIITQNIDDLHERSGSTNVLHLHGVITKMKSVYNGLKFFDYTDDIKVGDKAEDGGQLRPHVVWFGEDVPNIEPASKLARDADIFVIIGTSLNVYPAANLIYNVRSETPIYIIDPKIPDIDYMGRNIVKIESKASIGIQEFIKIIKE